MNTVNIARAPVGSFLRKRIKMAEAAVEQRQNRFFCHQCSVEISPNLPVSKSLIVQELFCYIFLLMYLVFMSFWEPQTLPQIQEHFSHDHKFSEDKF